MRSNIAWVAAVAQLAAAAPAPAPQQFDFAAVLDAPSPSATGPPTSAVSNTSTTPVDTAAAAASISAQVTTQATASVTGASASAASTQTPTASSASLAGRGLVDLFVWPRDDTMSTSSTSSSASTSSSQSTSSASAWPVTTSSATSTTSQSTGTTTTSSSTACPTQPEAGTYCGFINPEDPCAPQPDGYGPVPTPNTVAAFQTYQPFIDDAMEAETPSGYAEAFRNLNGSVSANSYITFQTLTSYDVAGCANLCDNTNLCTAFNIYIERDPSLNPTNTGPSDNSTGQYCPNPAAITNYKCSLWGSSISAADATNLGGWRDEFQVVIAASNGYDKSNHTIPAAPSGWGQPSKCPGGAISAGGSYWLGSKFFPGPFNPNLCGVYGQAQAATNKKLAVEQGQHSYTPCNMFNAYMVKKNGHPQGTYCSLFNTVLDSSWASTQSVWSGSDRFDFESSWTFPLAELDSGEC